MLVVALPHSTHHGKLASQHDGEKHGVVACVLDFVSTLLNDALKIRRYDAKRYLHGDLEQLPGPSAANELRPHVDGQIYNEHTTERSA